VPREGAVIFRDIAGKLAVLRVECEGRMGPRRRARQRRLAGIYRNHRVGGRHCVGSSEQGTTGLATPR
jgi:hypothetical protein